MGVRLVKFDELDFNELGIYLVIFTPEIAKNVLETRNYEKQRPIKQKLGLYVADMKNGNWRLTMADPLVFTKNGLLINGQHRLTAVVESGMPQPFYVSTGANESEFQFIDIGIGRTAADGLSGQVKNATRVAALSRRIMNVMRGYSMEVHVAVKKVVTNADIHSYCLSRDEHLQTLVSSSQRMCKSIRAKGFGETSYSVALWLMGVKDESMATSYLEAFCSGAPSVTTTREAIFKRALSNNPKSSQWLTETLLQSFDGYVQGVPRKAFNKGPLTFDNYAKLARTKAGWWTESNESDGEQHAEQ